MNRYFITSFWCRTKFGTENTIVSFPYITTDDKFPNFIGLYSQVNQQYNVEVISLVSISELSESDYYTFFNNN